MNRFLRDILGVSLARTVAFVLNFIVGILLARGLGPEGRGLYATLLVVPMMVISFAELGIRRSSIYHIGKSVFNPEEVISTISVVWIVSSTVGIAICAAVYFSIHNPEITVLLATVTLFTIPITLLTRFSRGILIGKQQYKKNNVLLILPPVLNILLILILVFWNHQHVLGAIIALLSANFIIAVLIFRLLYREYRIRFKINKEILSSLLKLGLVYAFAMLLVKLNYKIDILLLQQLSNLREVGFYSLGASLAEQWQIPFATGAVIISKTANSDNALKMTDDIFRLARITFVASFCIFLVFFFIVPWFVPLVYGNSFIPSIGIIRYILPGILFLITAKIFGTSLAGMMKTHLVIYIFLVALIINVGLNLILIPKYGGVGAAIATDVSYTLGATGTILTYLKTTQTGLKDLLYFQAGDFKFFKKDL